MFFWFYYILRFLFSHSKKGILEGNTMLMVHCYMVQDMEMMIRTSKEFNFSIKAFHHALEAWKIPTILKSLFLSLISLT